MLELIISRLRKVA